MIVGVLIVAAFPLYLAFVASTHTAQTSQAPMPLPGSHLENLQTAPPRHARAPPRPWPA
jgi:hypothetical protein